MRKVETELKHLLTSNFIKNKFNRIDILVIKYSIEQYLKDEKYDFDMYSKMQEYRGSYEDAQILIDRFKKLIKSFEEKGYDNNFEIEEVSVGRDGRQRSTKETEDVTLSDEAYDKHTPFIFTKEFELINGAHRLAYIYLKKITPVSCVIENTQILPRDSAGQLEAPYGIEWFEERFSTKDLEIINNEVDELNKYLKND